MNTKKLSIAGACALTLGLASAQAVTINSIRNSGSHSTNKTQEYVFSPDFSNPITLDAANTYVLNHTWGMWNNADAVVVGKLEIATGGLLRNDTGGDRKWEMSDNTVLNGGTLDGSNAATKVMTVDGGEFDFSLQSGTLTANSGATLRIIDADLSGAGTIDVTGLGTVQFQSTVDTTGFSGNFNVTGSTFDLDEITSASFGLSLSSAGVYANDADAAFTSLTIMGSAVANDTYTRSKLLAYGTSEYSQDWSALIGDGGGVITVITVVPEPGSYALLGGCLALSWVMVRRRRS